MDFQVYIDGEKFEGCTDILEEIEHEDLQKNYLTCFRTGTFTAETNIRTMSDLCRSYFKVIRWNGKVYL